MPKKKVGYLGPKGTFSYAAFELYAKKHAEIEAVPVPTIADLYVLLDSDQLDQALIPIENSIEGSVTDSMDNLARANLLFIKNELRVPVRHCLMSKTSLPLDQIQLVLSHHQPLAQCQNYLHENVAQALTRPVSSTAFAAEMISSLNMEDNAYSAIIGDQSLSRIYDLKILAEEINDYKHNVTRFVVLSKEKTDATNNDKTSIVFAAQKDQPGSLYEILGEFARRNINLTRITSRPTKQYLGEYLFFIDFEGHKKNPLINEALEAVQTRTSFYRWLGSYPKD